MTPDEAIAKALEGVCEEWHPVGTCEDCDFERSELAAHVRETLARFGYKIVGECIPSGTKLVQNGTDDEHACR